MNILAEEQKKLIKDDILLDDSDERTQKYLKLYYMLREKEEKKEKILSLRFRQKIHWFILSIYKIKNRMEGLNYKVIKNEMIKTDRPIIFAVTHVGKFDIEVISEAIKEHYYLLSGDYEHIQGTVDGTFLCLNGVFYFNEHVKEDRKAVSERMITHLCKKGNLMYFIEGTWNLSPNLPMLPCYWGIIDVARKGNAVIVPVAAEQYDKRFKINIGKNFEISRYGDGVEEKKRAIDDLRDCLSTLKWEIWETERLLVRHDIDENIWNHYVEKRLEEWPYFDERYIAELVYKPKNVVERKEVFYFLKLLIPKKNNAFLFDKRLFF